MDPKLRVRLPERGVSLLQLGSPEPCFLADPRSRPRFRASKALAFVRPSVHRSVFGTRFDSLGCFCFRAPCHQNPLTCFPTVRWEASHSCPEVLAPRQSPKVLLWSARSGVFPLAKRLPTRGGVLPPCRYRRAHSPGLPGCHEHEARLRGLVPRPRSVVVKSGVSQTGATRSPLRVPYARRSERSCVCSTDGACFRTARRQGL
jgi:hypothetical protein